MKKVVLVGLGAVGLTYAVKLRDKCDLFVLSDIERIRKFKQKKPVFNGVEQDFNYILPDEQISADLIITATKAKDLDSVIKIIKNFVSAQTRIISLTNGITSEKLISEAYPQAKVLKSYFIGHSAVRDGNCVIQDGVGEIVLEHDDVLEQFFKEVGINYSVPNDIDYSMWLKFAFNSLVNPVSAILNMEFGRLKTNKIFKNFAKSIIFEIKQIAEKQKINNIENLEHDIMKSLDRMCDEGKTSMLQDVLAKRPTEIDIFSGEIIRMGEKYGIDTPYNQMLYSLIKIKEEDYEHSIYTCQRGQ